MENLDSQTIQQVWQRVQQKPQPPNTPELLSVLAGLRQEAALYALLLKRTNRTGFQPLLKQANRHIASIKGMMILAGQNPQDTPAPPSKQEPVNALLRHAYTNTLGRLTEYEKRTSDAAFGPVFQVLATETRNSLRTLTEICGMQ